MASGAELAILMTLDSSKVESGLAKTKGHIAGLGDTASKSGGMLSGFGSALGSIGMAGMAVQGLAGIASGIAGVASSMISGNVQMETYETQLSTLLGGADKAKERIAQLAKIGAETPFDLPQLVAAEKIMAGFGLTTEKTMQLSGRSLDDYRRDIGDMAAATGAPLDEVTLLWSKFGSGATGEAISRLQELGIVTREQMAGMGIEFSKSGELISPVPQAMKVAMDLAKEKMGGGMKALSETFAGQMSTLGDTWGQMKVLMMAPLFDIAKSGLSGLNEFLSSGEFQAGLTSVAESVASAIQTMIDVFGVLADVFNGELLTLDGMTMLTNLFPMGVAFGIVGMVQSLGNIFRDVMEGNIPGALDNARGFMNGFLAFIIDAIESLAETFVSWIPEVASGWGEGTAQLSIDMMDWLLQTAVGIVEVLATWAAAFLDWIGPMIGPFLRELGSMFAKVWEWMGGTALPMLVETLARWGLAFVEWIAPRIGPILSELGSLLMDLGAWLIGTALPAIISQLAEWGAAFVAWVGPKIPPLLAELGSLLLALGAWALSTALPAIVTQLAQWALAFVQWTAEVLTNLPGKLVEIGAAIGSWIVTTAGSFLSEAGKIGQSIVDGIVNALGRGVQAIKDAAMRAARAALDAAIAIIQPGSPSKVFTELGLTIPQGLALGIAKGSGLVDAAISSLSLSPSLGGVTAPYALPSAVTQGAMSGASGGSTGSWASGGNGDTYNFYGYTQMDAFEEADRRQRQAELLGASRSE